MNETGHEKVYVVCENLCLEEGMTKEQIETKFNNTMTKEQLETKFNNIDNNIPRETMSLKRHVVLTDGTDLNNVTTCGTYRSEGKAHTLTMSNVPTDLAAGFTMYVKTYTSTYSNNSYLRQEIVHNNNTWVRYTLNEGSTWYDWTKVIMSNNFAVIEGNMTLTANTTANQNNNIEAQTIKLIDFPSGFNKDNCICLAFGMKLQTSNGYSFGTDSNGASYNMVSGSFNRNIVLGAPDNASKIHLFASQSKTSATKVDYRIVLMKIN